jgi:hypothetical protein
MRRSVASSHLGDDPSAWSGEACRNEPDNWATGAMTGKTVAAAGPGLFRQV